MLTQRKVTQNEAVSLQVRRASDAGAQPGSSPPSQATSRERDSKEPISLRLPAPTFAIGYLCTGTALAVLGQVVTNQVRLSWTNQAKQSSVTHHMQLIAYKALCFREPA